MDLVRHFYDRSADARPAGLCISFLCLLFYNFLPLGRSLMHGIGYADSNRGALVRHSDSNRADCIGWGGRALDLAWHMCLPSGAAHGYAI